MNRADFDVLWERVIEKQVKLIRETYADLVFADYLKDDIFREAVELMEYCKHHYMKNSEKYIDRHKVGAAVMIAILKNSPIKKVGAIYYTDNSVDWCFNEHLAITAGLSVLVSFAKKDLNENFAGAELNEKLSKLKNGIVFPKVKHGAYRENWAAELHYTHKNGNYNILALAHELFFLEHYTMEL